MQKVVILELTAFDRVGLRIQERSGPLTMSSAKSLTTVHFQQIRRTQAFVVIYVGL